MFIFREEIYDPKPENAGQAEIIVAKHRSGPTGVVQLAFLAAVHAVRQHGAGVRLMETSEAYAAVRGRMLALAAGADPATPVPACPEWTARGAASRTSPAWPPTSSPATSRRRAPSRGWTRSSPRAPTRTIDDIAAEWRRRRARRSDEICAALGDAIAQLIFDTVSSRAGPARRLGRARRAEDGARRHRARVGQHRVGRQEAGPRASAPRPTPSTSPSAIGAAHRHPDAPRPSRRSGCSPAGAASIRSAPCSGTATRSPGCRSSRCGPFRPCGRAVSSAERRCCSSSGSGSRSLAARSRSRSAAGSDARPLAGRRYRTAGGDHRGRRRRRRRRVATSPRPTPAGPLPVGGGAGRPTSAAPPTSPSTGSGSTSSTSPIPARVARRADATSATTDRGRARPPARPARPGQPPRRLDPRHAAADRAPPGGASRATSPTQLGPRAAPVQDRRAQAEEPRPHDQPRRRLPAQPPWRGLPGRAPCRPRPRERARRAVGRGQPGRPTSQQAMGAAVRSEAWAATPGQVEEGVHLRPASGGSTPRRAAKAAIQSAAERASSGMAATLRWPDGGGTGSAAGVARRS